MIKTFAAFTLLLAGAAPAFSLTSIIQVEKITTINDAIEVSIKSGTDSLGVVQIGKNAAGRTLWNFRLPNNTLFDPDNCICDSVAGSVGYQSIKGDPFWIEIFGDELVIIWTRYAGPGYVYIRKDGVSAYQADGIRTGPSNYIDSWVVMAPNGDSVRIEGTDILIPWKIAIDNDKTGPRMNGYFKPWTRFDLPALIEDLKKTELGDLDNYASPF